MTHCLVAPRWFVGAQERVLSQQAGGNHKGTQLAFGTLKHQTTRGLPPTERHVGRITVQQDYSWFVEGSVTCMLEREGKQLAGDRYL